ncbi:MAG: hypothetical protein QOE70_1049 [Chthoniobacter sp.]|jgi:hypothetical protein|nr:hypothetical protein [Chthoniobacter sp.]
MRLFPVAAAFLVASLATAVEPAFPIGQAVAVAQQSLKERGLEGKYYITSVKLAADDARRSSFHWAIDWSDSIPVSELKKEVGLEIKMDGSVVSIVKGPANRNPSTGAFDPNGSTGLQNYRTRADRPSILNLKH